MMAEDLPVQLQETYLLRRISRSIFYLEGLYPEEILFYDDGGYLWEFPKFY